MIRVVLVKELLDHLRDRRSLLASGVLPVLGPLLLVAVFRLLSDIGAERPLSLPVVGPEHAPRLVEFLEQRGATILPPPARPHEAVREGEADLVLIIDPDYGERFASGRAAPVRLIVDDSQSDTQRSARRVERVLIEYAQRLGALRLVARGLAPELATPIAIEVVDLSTPQRLAANVLSVVPLFLMLAALVGGMNLAIDTTAGERERGSLEPLLLNPAPRATLALGKWLATAAASAAVATLTLLGFMLVVAVLPLEELGLRLLLGPREAALMWLAVAPLALFGSALQMLIATFARSFKEAQTYLNLLNLLPLAPALFLMFEPAPSAWWMLLLPTLAQICTVLDVMRGEPVLAWQYLLILASSLAYTGVCLLLLERLLRLEKIIFGRP